MPKDVFGSLHVLCYDCQGVLPERGRYGFVGMQGIFMVCAGCYNVRLAKCQHPVWTDNKITIVSEAGVGYHPVDSLCAVCGVKQWMLN